MPQRRKPKGNTRHVNYSYKIRPKNDSQAEAIETFNNNTITFMLGPAGTGKTYLAAALAAKEVIETNKDKVIITRPLVESQESMGWLPGDVKEKTDPYMAPFFTQYKKCTNNSDDAKDALIVQPLGFTRGHTFENAICILDEAQNCNYAQLKLYLTRLGENCKYIITGDHTQYDVSDSGLEAVVKKVENIDGIGVHKFANEHIVRHPLVMAIEKAL